MIALLLAASFGQACASSHCQQQAVVATPAAIVATPVAFVAPTLVYSPGESERLQKLEANEAKLTELLAKQTQILEQNAQLVAAIKTQQAAAAESKLAMAARQILERNCTSCHKPGNAKADVDLTQSLSPAAKLLVADVADAGSMPPPPAKALSDEDAQTLRAWALEDRAAARAALRSAVKSAIPEAVPRGQATP